MSLELEGPDAVLPDGLQIEHQLFSGAIGASYAVLDQRHGKEIPVRRTLYVLTEQSESDWSAEFQARAQKLSTKGLPHIVRVLDYGALPDGDWFVLGDSYTYSLASQVPAEGLPPKLAKAILRRIARGLEELHRLGIAHGDLRLENVFIDTAALDATSGVWLGNAAVGHLPFASEGRLLESQAVHYLPPEWHDRVQTPSKSADVYALGVLACELFCGRKAVQEARSAEGIRKLLEARSSLPVWRRRLLGPSLFDTLQTALSANDSRPGDAAALFAAIERTKWWQHPWSVPLAMVLVIALFSLAMRSSYLNTIKHLREQLETSAKRFDSLEADNGRLKREQQETGTRLSSRFKEAEERATTLQRQHTEIASVLRSPDNDKSQLQRIREILSVPVPTDPESEAREFWAEHPELADNAAADEKAPAKPDGLSDEAWKRVPAWIGRVRQVSTDVQQLEKLRPSRKSAPGEPSVSQRALADLKRSPWDESQTEAVAQADWRETMDSTGSSEIVKRATDTSQKLSKGGALRTRFNAWTKQLLTEEKDWKRWVQDADSYERFGQRARAPWNKDAERSALAELDALKNAADIWTQKAKAAGTWNDFDRNTELAAKGIAAPADDPGRADAVNRILSRWKTQYHSKRDWKIRIDDGAASPGYGKYRILYIRVAGKDVSYIDEDWMEDSRRNKPASISSIAPFEWTAGQPLELELMAGRSATWGGGRPRLFKKNFTSPLVFWNLNRDRTLQVKGNSLDLSVPDCPGPPRDWDTSVGPK